MKFRNLLLAAAATAALAACGGGKDEVIDPPTASNEVPASATESTRAYSLFAGSLMNSETAMPVDVNKVKPPTSETDAPVAL